MFPGLSRHARSRGTVATAVAAIRGSPITVALIALSVILGLAAVLPLAGLFRAGTDGLHFRLALYPIAGDDLGLPWQGAVRLPSELRDETVGSLALLLLGVGGATLALTAMTVLAFSVAREAERTGDIAVRRAVGASSTVLRRAGLLEGAAVVLAAISAGGALAVPIGRQLVAAWPGRSGPGDLLPVGATILVLAGAVTAGLLLPAVFPRRALGEGGEARATPLTPVALQLGVALVTLGLAGGVGQRLNELTSTAPGAAQRGTVYLVALRDTARVRRAERWAALLGALDRPGRFDTVSLTGPGALLGLGPVGAVTTDCGRCSEGGIFLPWRVKQATYQLVSADSFSALRLAVFQGRPIREGDRWDTPRVAVVSRSLAAREFQDGQAVGRRIRLPDESSDWSLVVGVVDDRPAEAVGAALQPVYAVYLSVLQHPPSMAELLVRPHGGAAGAEPPPEDGMVRALLGPGGLVQTDRREVALRAAEARTLDWFRRGLAVQSWAMLLIAGLGTFAMMRLWVGSMRTELGVRRAVGASRAALARFVVRRVVSAAVGGLLLGVGLGASVWEMLPQLVGRGSWSPVLVAVPSGLIVLCALLGALGPTLRAARAQPTALLGGREG